MTHLAHTHRGLRGDASGALSCICQIHISHILFFIFHFPLRTCAKTSTNRSDSSKQSVCRKNRKYRKPFSCQPNFLRHIKTYVRPAVVLFSISFWRMWMFGFRELISNRLAFEIRYAIFSHVVLSGFQAFSYNEKHLCIFSSKSWNLFQFSFNKTQKHRNRINIFA